MSSISNNINGIGINTLSSKTNPNILSPIDFERIDNEYQGFLKSISTAIELPGSISQGSGDNIFIINTIIYRATFENINLEDFTPFDILSFYPRDPKQITNLTQASVAVEKAKVEIIHLTNVFINHTLAKIKSLKDRGTSFVGLSSAQQRDSEFRALGDNRTFQHAYASRIIWQHYLQLAESRKAEFSAQKQAEKVSGDIYTEVALDKASLVPVSKIETPDQRNLALKEVDTELKKLRKDIKKLEYDIAKEEKAGLEPSKHSLHALGKAKKEILKLEEYEEEIRRQNTLTLNDRLNLGSRARRKLLKTINKI
ncbi:MAG: hypothetical protein H0W88_05130 [Parachlamydiaceae bacterium]|nr:hypothetical protein [Parachlamydiaceae bacterium]